ncbi:MAG: hypothetical protein QW767_02160 [Thermoprotei archaeon]
MEYLESLMSRVSVGKLIIAGDLKDSVEYPTALEVTMIKKFAHSIREHSITPVLVKGNHDGLVESVADFECVDSYTTYENGKQIGIFHGHRVPDEVLVSDIVVSAHVHPSVKIGPKREFVWLFMKRRRGKPSQAVIIPPFNRFVGGGTISRGRVPILRRLCKGRSRWTTLLIGVDGVVYGDLDDSRV